MTNRRKPASPQDGGQRIHGAVVFGDVIQVQDVAGSVTISADRPPYRVEEFARTAQALPVEQARAQPSRLLLARNQVVPFTGRGEDVDQLVAWLDNAGTVSAHLIYAAGGHGKTRLAAHLAAVCAEAGWTVWRVLHGSAGTGSRVSKPTGRGVLAVVDYADRWPVSHVLALFTHLRNLNLHSAVAVRVLLLARSGGFWWSNLADTLDREYTLATTSSRLTPLGNQVDPVVLYRAARRQFADVMTVDGTDDLPIPGVLANEGVGQVLAIHMAALVGVDAHFRAAAVPTGPHALSAYLLRRERAHWHALNSRVEDRRQTRPEVMGRAVYIATLTGALQRADAQVALSRTGVIDPSIDTVIDDHRFCYPPDDPGTVLQGLYPDRLGEDLLALTTPGHSHTDDDNGWEPDDWASTAAHELLCDAKQGATPMWAPSGIAILVETAHRWDHFATNVLYPLVRAHPDLFLAAGGTALTRLADIRGIDPTVLEGIEARLPAQHVDLDTAAAAITRRLSEHRLAKSPDRREQARVHANLGWRLANAGLHDDAVTATQAAVGIYRELAGDDPEVLSALATTLSNLGSRLSEVGRTSDGLAAAEEAVEICRRLATDQDTYVSDLAMSLNNLGSHLATMGRPEALGVSGEAVDVYRRLVDSDDVHVPGLAAAINNLAIRLRDEGRDQEALTLNEEAAGIYRNLISTDPTTYLPDLAASLTNLGSQLAGMNRRDEGLAISEEAVAVSPIPEN